MELRSSRCWSRGSELCGICPVNFCHNEKHWLHSNRLHLRSYLPFDDHFLLLFTSSIVTSSFNKSNLLNCSAITKHLLHGCFLPSEILVHLTHLFASWDTERMPITRGLNKDNQYKHIMELYWVLMRCRMKSYKSPSATYSFGASLGYVCLSISPPPSLSLTNYSLSIKKITSQILG